MKKIVLGWLLLMCLVLTISVEASPATTVTKLDGLKLMEAWSDLQYGRREMLKRDYGAAIEDFTDALENNPYDIMALWLRSAAYVYSQQYDLATKDVETLVKMNPANYAAALGIDEQVIEKYKHHLNLYALSRLGTVRNISQWNDVYEDSRKKAEEINKDLPIAEAKKGMGDEQWNKLSAQKKIERLEKVDFEKGLTFYNQKVTLESRGKYFLPGSKVVETFKTAETNYKNGNYQQAIDEYTKVIEMSATFYDAYIHRALAYMKLNDKKAAFVDLTRVINLCPNYSAFPWGVRGYLWYMVRKPERAVQDYDKAIELDPGYADYYDWRADAYEELGKKAEATVDRKKYEELKKK